MKLPVGLVAVVLAGMGALVGCLAIEASRDSEPAGSEIEPVAAVRPVDRVLDEPLVVARSPEPAMRLRPAPPPEMKSAEPAPPRIANDAIRALVNIREKPTVDFLVTVAESLETEHAQNSNDRAAVRETLQALTGKDYADAATWRSWWTENRSTFVFPKAPDPDAVPEIASGLTEFKDQKYGFSVRKPDDPGWTFEKPEYLGPRVALSCASPEEPTYRIARAYFSVISARKFPKYKDVQAMVEWARADIFAKQLDTHGRALDERTVGQWTVLSGKGDGIDLKRGWGAMERRFYFAPIGADILYIDAFVRLGSEDETKKALWDAVEATVIPAK